MTPENQQANVRDEVARGNEALQAAEELLRLGFFNDTVSRAYYAAYHWAKALLLSKGMESKTHRGMVQLVALRFVREGLLPGDAATVLAQLEDAREASDYAASTRFTEQEARDTLERARAFIEFCKPVLGPILGADSLGE